MRPYPFLIICLLPFSVWVGYRLGGAYNFLTPLLVFGLIPLLDLLFGVDARNPGEQEMNTLGKDRRFRIIPWLCAPLQVAFVIWAAYVVTRHSLGFVETVGFVFSVGITSGALGINVSHELVHRINNRFEPFLGRMMLATVGYLHWAVEHVKGHHRNVATPRDPATARLGESFYEFWPRTVIGGFRSAWEIEAQRLERKGRGIWSPHNAIVRYLVVEVFLVAGLAWAFGFGAVFFFIAQSLVAVSLLEVVNYLEHYGMERRKLEDGRYEKVTPLHSWNASHWVTNHFLFNLQRHSDHHASPAHRYQLLRHFEESPQLPNGYAGMVLLALVPPLWRRVMDGRVEAFRDKQGVGEAGREEGPPIC